MRYIDLDYIETLSEIQTMDLLQSIITNYQRSPLLIMDDGETLNESIPIEDRQLIPVEQLIDIFRLLIGNINPAILNTSFNYKYPSELNHIPCLLIYSVIQELPDILDILITSGCDVNSLDANGDNALSYIAMSANTINVEKCLNILLDAGIDINHQNYEGYTPLMWAKQFGNSMLGDRLMELGCDISLQNSMGITADNIGNVLKIR